ncbi:MAG TPA: flagellar hook-length control protein FliK, partial [Gemmatirosa sp.]
PGGVATVAAVAPVAQVAPVASIAPVASAAMPGAIAHPVAAGHPAAHPAAQSTVHLTSQAAAHPATSGAPRVTAHDTPRTDGPHAAGRRASSPPTRGTTVTSRPLPGADIARGAGARSRGRGEDHMDDHDREQPPRGDTRAHDSAAPTDVAGTDASPTPVAAPTTTATTAGATGAPALVAPAPDASAGTAASTDAPPTLGAIAAERIARVLDAQQAAAPRTVSHLTVRVDRADGGEDRIHLDLRGQAVDARIDVADLSTADSLTARTPELRAALAQHGLTTDDVRVRAAPGDPRGGSDAVSALDDAGATSVASFGRAPQTDSGTGDQARDPSRDQPARDPDARGEQRSDGRSSDRHAQDDGSSGRRTSDQHQGRRRPSDDVFPATAPRGAGRTTA